MWQRQLHITATGCHRFYGVWGAVQNNVGPEIVHVDGEHVTTEMRAEDPIGDNVFIDANGDVVAVRARGYGAQNELVVYPANGEPVVLDHTTEHYDDDDVPSSYGVFQLVAASPLDTIVHAEQHQDVEALRVATREDSGCARAACKIAMGSQLRRDPSW